MKQEAQIEVVFCTRSRKLGQVPTIDSMWNCTTKEMSSSMNLKNINYPKAGFTLLLLIYGVVCVRNVNEATLLDRVDLIAHEAGHLLFGYFGEFMLVIGGTLGQLLVPVGIGAYFVAQREFFSATVLLFWLGQNFLNISVYVKDAAAMELPMVGLGGGDVIHDWNWLLLKFNILAWDQTIGNLVYGVGVLVMVIAIGWGFYLSVTEEEADGSQRTTL